MNKNLINSNFSIDTISGAWAYGSAVFKQENIKNEKQPLLDLILLTKDLANFHFKNRIKNPNHYTWITRNLPISWIVKFNRWGPGLWYHANISLKTSSSEDIESWYNDNETQIVYQINDGNDFENDQQNLSKENNEDFSVSKSSVNPNVMVKYGVICEQDAKNDLLQWQYLYLAGRAHKPLFRMYFQKSSYEKIEFALQENRRIALKKVSSVVINEHEIEKEDKSKSSENLEKNLTDDILLKIIRLSYDGDIRMKFAEDPKKLTKIIDNQRDILKKIYQPLFFKNNKINQQHQINSSHPGESLLFSEIRKRVFWGSLIQTIKGGMLNSPHRTLQYTTAKLLKRIRKG